MRSWFWYIPQADDLVSVGVVGGTPVVELGFPSYFTHALYERPFLGFAGALAFIDSMANELRRIDLIRRGRGR